MSATPLFHKVDAVTIPVPDLDAGLRFYRDSLGHQLRWRNDAIGQAGLALAASDTEIVLTTRHGYEPDWLVDSADGQRRAVSARTPRGPSTASGPTTSAVSRSLPSPPRSTETGRSRWLITNR
jgi:catechol 2,3-dioxygenase-like lactoylglutathione lyase family enzyme